MSLHFRAFRRLRVEWICFLSDSLSLFMHSIMIRYVRNIIIKENTKVLIYIYIYIHTQTHSHIHSGRHNYILDAAIRARKRNEKHTHIHISRFDRRSFFPALQVCMPQQWSIMKQNKRNTAAATTTTGSFHFYVSVFEW